MNQQEITALVQSLILQNKTKEALEAMMIYTKGFDQSMEGNIIILTGRYVGNENDNSRDIISNNIYKRTLAQITHAILQTLSSLPQKGNAVGGAPTTLPLPSDTALKTRILFLSANPSNSTRLALDDEYNKVKGVLREASQRDDISLEIETAVTKRDISGAMQRVNPTIVHFSGHGEGEEGIMIAGSDNKAVMLSNEAINLLFSSFETVRCVVLNACYSYVQAKIISQKFNGIYVLGMNTAIGDSAAIDIAVGFYQSIGEGKDYQFAFKMALFNNSVNPQDAHIPELWHKGEKLPISL